MVSHILETLEKAEEVWRAKSPEWNRKISRWEAWQTRQKKKERLAQKAVTRKRDLDDEIPHADIAELRWTSTPDFLFRALRRGIAVHHSGMNKTYRVFVERCVLVF